MTVCCRIKFRGRCPRNGHSGPAKPTAIRPKTKTGKRSRKLPVCYPQGVGIKIDADFLVYDTGRIVIKEGIMEKKEKQAVWLYPETKELMISHLKAANARSQSEFIEDAIRFYVGYLDCNSSIATEYLAPVLTSIIDGIVKGSEYRINRGLFKLAVESAMQSHIISAVNDIDDETVDDLRGMCVDEVRHINGVINFEKAYDYQNRSDDDE